MPVVDIRRRFYRSHSNLVEIYLPLADRWTIWDATRTRPVPLFDSTRSSAADVRSHVTRTLTFPPPLPAKDLPEHVRRAMRAFARVHKMLEAKAAAERIKTKRRRRAKVA